MADIFNVDRTNNTITLGTTGTVTNLPFLTTSKLLALDGSKNIVSTDLNSWVVGTANQITVTDDGDGTITLSTPQSIHAGASPQFTGIELGHASDTTLTRVSAGVVAIEGTNIAMVGGAHHDGFSDFVANEHIDHSSITLTAGTGLTGGGDISANRTFAVDGLLEDLDTLGANSADSEFLVGTGAGALAWESGATARTSIGLGTTDNPQLAGLGIGVAATAGTMVVRSLGADGEDIFVVERATSDLAIINYLSDAGTDSCSLELKRGGSTLINLSTRSTDDSYFNMAGGLAIGGTDAKTKLTVEGSLTLKEQASADGDTAAYGQLWVKTATPNQLWFTDDAGTDFQLGSGLHKYTDRGDPAAADFDQNDLTIDNTWRDLDLSSIIGTGIRLVHLSVYVVDNAASTRILFRENGNSNAFNAEGTRSQVANVAISNDVWVLSDSSGVVEYIAMANIDTISITVRGWFS